MRGSVRVASERRNARVKQAAVCLSNKVTFPAHIGRPLRIRRRPGIVTRIFAGVHMLSHVVATTATTGGGQRGALGKGERQQRQLHEGFVERDRTFGS
jgi:hypothetical protein